jgi:hypothetical protein
MFHGFNLLKALNAQKVAYMTHHTPELGTPPLTFWTVLAASYMLSNGLQLVDLLSV